MDEPRFEFDGGCLHLVDKDGKRVSSRRVEKVEYDAEDGRVRYTLIDEPPRVPNEN